ncbi:MAG: hypothetical protein DI556_03495 [Rhodovulum sulfidophilum]|uniref:Right handed beta helix domain-containing protein n=1 Tax=Rhodovulum sulfidophilum TaxID=35806 RepID=A0A2W5NFK8_RHOSU|nr:MAG: hypothetical protein DI556_03495 [Rhodovulum sulfidophilum]
MRPPIEAVLPWLALIFLASSGAAVAGPERAGPARDASHCSEPRLVAPEEIPADPVQIRVEFPNKPIKLARTSQQAGKESEARRSNKAATGATSITGDMRGGACGGVSGAMSDLDSGTRTGAIYLRPGDDVRAIVDASPEGQVFVLTAGVYHNLTITPKDHQTFIGEDGAVLSGAVAITGWTQAADLWSADGFPDPGWSHGDGRDGMAALTEDLFFDGAPLLRVASLAEVTEGTFYYADGRVHTRADPTGKVTEASKTQAAFAGEQTVGVTIANLEIRQYASPAQHGAISAHRTTDWTLIDVTATGNHGAGVSAGDGMRILGGIYSGNGQVGIHAYDTTGLVIDGVVAAGNNYAGFSQTWDAGGIKILTSDNVTIRNSEIAANAGMGLWLDWDNRDVTIENNHVHDNAYIGIFYEASYAAAITGNNVRDNNRDGYVVGYWGSDIFVTSSAGVTITGNLVWSSIGQGIGLEQATREDGAHGAHVLADAVVTGNTIVMAGAGLNGVSGAVRDVLWDANTYVALAPGDLFFTWDSRYFGVGDRAGAAMDAESRFVYLADLRAFLVEGFLEAADATHDIGSGGVLALRTSIGAPLAGTLGIQAILLDGPAHGTLTLGGDGAFVYAPEAGFRGLDSFGYFAIGADGRGVIGVAEVAVLPDALTLRVSGDAWNSAPEFDVIIDGVAHRGFATSASHAEGAWQEIRVEGDFGDDGPREVSVVFTNDAYGGPGLDRNLYVRDLTVNGETYDAGFARSTAGWSIGAVAPLVTDGAVTFDVSAEADVFVLRVAGDGFDGDPEFTITLDGKALQGFTATASHAAGDWQEITLRGVIDLAPGDTARIDFVNDAYAGPGQDRNLYVGGASYNGAALVARPEGSVEILDDGYLLARNDGLTFGF